MRGVMGKEKEKEGTEAESGNNWDSGKGVEEERREGDMRKEDRKEDDDRVREKDNRKEDEERVREKGDMKEDEERVREKDDRIRAGSLGLRNRIGRTAQDEMCQKCKEGEVENEQHVVLKCPAYRVERNRMLGKVRRIWGGREMGSLDGQRRRGAAQGDSSFVWGPIVGVSQNGGRRGLENDEGKRGVKKREMRQGCVVITCFKPLYNTVTFGLYYS